MKLLLSLLALLYAISPYDLFPDFFVGWGWLDDLTILGLLWWYFFVYRRKKDRYASYYERSRSSFDGQRPRQDKHGGAAHGPKEKDTPIDPYTVLGVGRDATPETIRKAYRQLANKYHPDKVNHLGEEFRELAGRRFKEIQSAYQELMARGRDPKPRFHK